MGWISIWDYEILNMINKVRLKLDNPTQIVPRDQGSIL